MVLTNEELKEIYFGAYEFGETEDGYLQVFQYSKEQIGYFKGTIDMWYERCTASTAKTLEFTTSARKVAFDYKIIWKGSPDSKVMRAVKNEKVLWLGDSITQGYGPLRSSCTYVSVANRILNYDIINQGIGGYIYDKNSLMKMEGYEPDKIIVALGTNQYKDNLLSGEGIAVMSLRRFLHFAKMSGRSQGSIRM